MNIDIRKYVIDNFKNSNDTDIRNSIEDAIQKRDEITLPGLGVFFELLWSNSDQNKKEEIISSLKKGL